MTRRTFLCLGSCFCQPGSRSSRIRNCSLFRSRTTFRIQAKIRSLFTPLVNFRQFYSWKSWRRGYFSMYPSLKSISRYSNFIILNSRHCSVWIFFRYGLDHEWKNYSLQEQFLVKKAKCLFYFSVVKSRRNFQPIGKRSATVQHINIFFISNAIYIFSKCGIIISQKCYGYQTNPGSGSSLLVSPDLDPDQIGTRT